MRFTGKMFDTTTITQLTSGEKFFPTWSPDGQWIAYNRAVCEGPKTCGIWIMSSDGQQQRFLAAYGGFPCWKPSASNEILYITRAVTSNGQVIGDSLWTFNIRSNINSFFPFIGGQNNDNRCPRYSPDGTRIAFWSNGNLWLMDTTGNNQYQLTTHGADVDFGLPFSWSPSGDKLFTRDINQPIGQ